jgi:hypothetical protein
MTAAAATMSAALHLSDRIKDYGSYAGFACVLGLAVLSLLYFAQAREVKRLREWAGRAPERDAELQARVTAEAQQRAATPAAVPAAAAAAPAAAAATPAGQAAAAKPATPAAQPAAPAAGGPAPAKPGQPQPAATPGQPQPAATPGRPSAQPPAPKPGVPAPATAAAAAAGAAAASPATTKPEAPKDGDGDGAAPPAGAGGGPGSPTPATPSGANGAVDQPTQITPAPAAAASAAPKPAPKPGQPLRPPASPPVAADEHEHSPLRATLMIVGGVLGVIAVVLVLVFTVFSGGGDKKTPNTIGNAPATTPGSSSQGGTSTGSKAAPVARGDVEVAVLNGTTVPGLAREVGTKLQNAGFKLGTVTNAPDQARSATVVAYQPGHVNEARVVARLIHVGTDAVKQIDQSTAVVAGQGAFVVVTVGADQST